MSFQIKSHPFPPSAQQRTFFQWLMEGAGSAILVACAGAAKSTSVVEGLQYIRSNQSVKMLAFNVTIAEELNNKIDELRNRLRMLGETLPKAEASTFHSAGNYAVKKHLGARDLRPNPQKVRQIARNWLPEHEYEMYGDYICKLVGLAKGEGIGALCPDVESTWVALAQHHDLELDHQDATEERGVELARELLKRSNEAARGNQPEIDFDDQLYLVVLWKLRLWQHDWVIVDEAQDTNPVRRAICKLLLKPGGRLVAVGDPEQAIYGFTGASADALELIKHEFNCTTLRLSVSFRCSKAVVLQAQRWVPTGHIEAAENAPQGATPEMSIVDALKHLDEHSAIVCRNTAPLISMAYALIAAGKPCHVLGREIGDGLANLIKKMKARSIDMLEKRLQQYYDREVGKFMAKGQEGKAQGVEDKVECIRVLISMLTEAERYDKRVNPVERLLQNIKELFQDGNSRLILATIHKVKGKEYRVVAVLRPELSPSRYARQDWQLAEERRLCFVRDSRAKEMTITLLDDHEALQHMKGRAA